MKKLIKIGVLSMIWMVPLWSIEIHSMTEAVNIAGKQRMFTQKMLKDYAMIGMGNTFGDPVADIQQTISLFTDHLNSLKSYAKDEATKASLNKVETLWKEVEPELKGTPDVSKVRSLQAKLDALLHASDEVTKAFAKASGTKSGEIVNIAGRQRMLSQRMASLYMLKVWGVKDPEFKEKLDTALTEFKEALAKLEKTPVNTDETKALLSKVKRSFMFFEMMNRSKSKFIPTLIYKKSDDILKNMNTVTQLYVKNETK